MNGKSSTGIILVFLGVAVVYAAATGNLQSAWRGLKGDCGSTSTSGGASGTPPAIGDGPGGGGTGAPVGGEGEYAYVSTDGRLWRSSHGGIL